MACTQQSICCSYSSGCGMHMWSFLISVTMTWVPMLTWCVAVHPKQTAPFNSSCFWSYDDGGIFSLSFSLCFCLTVSLSLSHPHPAPPSFFCFWPFQSVSVCMYVSLFLIVSYIFSRKSQLISAMLVTWFMYTLIVCKYPAICMFCCTCSQ